VPPPAAATGEGPAQESPRARRSATSPGHGDEFTAGTSTPQAHVDIYVDIERMGYVNETLCAMWRDEAAFRVSHPPRPPGWGADLLQTVPSGDRSRPVREDPWHARADPQLGTGARGVAPEPKARPAMHRLRAALSASSPAMGSPTRRPQAWRDQYRPQGPLA